MLKKLQKMLHSRSAIDRAQAAEELGTLGEKARPCIQDLIGALKDPDPYMRWGACRRTRRTRLL